MDDLYGLPAEALARHLPQSLSRGVIPQIRPIGSLCLEVLACLTMRGEAVVLAFHAVQPPNTEMEPDVFAPLNEADTAGGAERRRSPPHKTTPTPRRTPPPPLLPRPPPKRGRKRLAHGHATKCEARAVRPKYVRPATSSRLDDLDMGFCGKVEEEKPTKKKGSKKRKKTSQEEPLPEVKFTPRPAVVSLVRESPSRMNACTSSLDSTR